MSTTTTTTIIEVPHDGPDEEISLSFTSEALGLPMDAGFGFPRFKLGQTLENRYTIVRKLGRGTHGSCWMVREQYKTKKSYLAIKALTGYVTKLAEEGFSQELKALLMLSDPPSPHCLSLLDHFIVPGTVEEVDGKHICLATSLFGGDVKTLLSALSKEPGAHGTIPVSLAKRILLHTLRGLAHAHAHGVAHTDLKPDNIFFTTQKDSPALEAWMAGDPARTHPPEPSFECIVEPVVSQPLPAPSLDEALRATYVLGDFSTAHVSDEPGSRVISPPGLRAPEVFLGGQWGLPADIWSFGVMIFEIICNRALFSYQPHPYLQGDAVANMLMQMGLFTEEKFTADIVARWPHAANYLDDRGKLKHLKTPFGFDIEIKADPLERPIAMYMDGIMPMEEVLEMKNVIKRCLRLDPAKRVTAEELLQDPWWTHNVA